MKKKILIAVTLLFSLAITKAEVRLANIFGDHMVIQQNKPIHIWGWAKAGEKITIILDKQHKTLSADKSGKWLVTFDAMKAGGPYVLTVKGKNTITFSDIMIGELWLCSGQSNMQFELKNSSGAEKEMSLPENRMIREFKVKEQQKAVPVEDIPVNSWKIASPETLGSFSAVAYYYAKKLSSELNVTVGIVNSSWGGTFIEEWMSFDALHALHDYSTYHQISEQELENWYVQTTKKYDDLFSSLGIQDRNNIKEDSLNWLNPAFNDNKWLPAVLPNRFDYQLLPRFDGVVWFRRTINVPESMAGQECSIHLGRIDDYDITYINGIKVGETMGDGEKRVYKIPSGVLKPGKNVIAVRLLDYWERGGFLDKDEDFKITFGNHSVPLAGEWKMNIGKMTPMWLRSPNVHPNLLYNGMIYPLRQLSFSGVVWYQGENNTIYANQYSSNLIALIGDWRKTFSSPDLPFYIVQLPNMDHFNTNSQHGGSNWAELRESQSKALSLPETYLAVTIDLGDSTDVHPKNKLDVGNRLALLALKNTYKANVGEVSSPMVEKILFENGRAVITFKNTGKGLVAKDKYGYLKGFEVAASDQKFYLARAEIDGNKIIVTCNKIDQPVAVRYAWSSNPSDANLYNVEGFPAAPFRSDNWQMVSQNEIYTNWIK